MDTTPNGTGVLRATTDWTDRDYLGTELFLAFKVKVPNETAQEKSHWEFWLCLSKTNDQEPKAFLGSVRARVEYLPDVLA